jgi:hypothetical protein
MRAIAGPACRQAAYRRRRDIDAGIPASTRRQRPRKMRLTPRLAAVTNDGPATTLAAAVAEIPQRNQCTAGPILATEAPWRRRSAELPARIVPDAKWPGMYRLVQSDGTLSDMVNLTRAKDALVRDAS